MHKQSDCLSSSCMTTSDHATASARMAHAWTTQACTTTTRVYILAPFMRQPAMCLIVSHCLSLSNLVRYVAQRRLEVLLLCGPFRRTDGRVSVDLRAPSSRSLCATPFVKKAKSGLQIQSVDILKRERERRERTL